MKKTRTRSTADECENLEEAIRKVRESGGTPDVVLLLDEAELPKIQKLVTEPIQRRLLFNRRERIREGVSKE